VRTLLVPSAVILIGRWNWWPSQASRASQLPGLTALQETRNYLSLLG
jgi:uncharacterized membrane protein YdfJ with MMPL/SSD domain